MIHVYYGEGKGKTTAAVGLALRAAGNGLSVVLVQFLKGRVSGEITLLRQQPMVTVLRGKEGGKFSFQMDEQQRQAARSLHEANLAEALRLVQADACDLLVLDEALGALACGLLPEQPLRQLLEVPPPGLEIVLTGRPAPDFVLQQADYITEMKCRRHPYTQGVAARKGIEY